MKTLENYTNGNHKMFKNELIKIDNKLFIVYKSKGYTFKSYVYGSIFHITQGSNLNLKLKTKKQVINFLSNLK